MYRRILMVYPEFPETFWSFKSSLGFVGKKTNFPPLSLLTVAALLPERYEVRVVDMNVQSLRPTDLDWADMVFTSSMLVQKESLERVIARVRKAGKPIVAGGPYPTQCWQGIEGVDHFVLNEAEITLPAFIADLEAGHPKHLYSSDLKPDLSQTPPPRYGLIDRRPYSSMALQFSRGCPNDCEFCDIVELFGRKPRVKPAGRFIAELESLHSLGHRGGIFIVDDNFIGNRVAVKELLAQVVDWQEAHGRPFTFSTEASVDLARDEELLALMVRAGFTMAFVGIETPVKESLESAHKRTNLGVSLPDSVRKIQESGIEVTAGFIVGFDTDPEDIAARQIAFIQESGIVTAMVGLLTALPNTRLHRRLKDEGRLLAESSGDNTHGLALNFVPKMEPSKLIGAYAEVLTTIYDPKRYFERCQVLLKRLPRRSQAGDRVLGERTALSNVRALLHSFFRQVLSPYGHHYLGFLATTLRRRPWMLAKALEKAIEGYSLIRMTRLKVEKPWARARALGSLLHRSILSLDRRIGKVAPTGLGGLFEESRAVHADLSTIAALAAKAPVLALVETSVQALSLRVASFVSDRSSHLVTVASRATEAQRRTLSAAVGRHRDKRGTVPAPASPLPGSRMSFLLPELAALDSMIMGIGSFAEAGQGQAEAG
ncbi:MAG: B12-binding domain-containing radical SAM protein [Spirochaetota bacterium]